MATNFEQEYTIKVFIEVDPDEPEPPREEQVDLFGQFIDVILTDALVNEMEVDPEFFKLEVTTK